MRPSAMASRRRVCRVPSRDSREPRYLGAAVVVVHVAVSPCRHRRPVSVNRRRRNEHRTCCTREPGSYAQASSPAFASSSTLLSQIDGKTRHDSRLASAMVNENSGIVDLFNASITKVW